jgi:hypothetical protein
MELSSVEPQEQRLRPYGYGAPASRGNEGAAADEQRELSRLEFRAKKKSGSGVSAVIGSDLPESEPVRFFFFFFCGA